MRIAKLLVERGGLVGLLGFALYAWLAPAHIVDGDNAEFVTLGELGGAAHPSGYPLYVLWLRLWSWLPIDSPAQRAAVATAMLGAAQLVVLHAACRSWGLRAAAANIAVAIFAGAPVVMTMHSEAEVFALNGLVVALVLWLAAAEGPLRGATRCAALALVAGLGMANHLTCTLVAPLGLLGVVRGVREAGDRRWLALGGVAPAFLLGLAPYLYLLIAPDHPGTWGTSRTFAELASRFFRDDYGGPGAFAHAGGEPEPAVQLVALGASLLRSWLWLPAVAGVVMLGVRVARPGPGEPRAGWAALAASFVIAGPLLATRFNLPPTGLGRYVVERFHLLPTLLLVLPVAAAIDAARARALPRALTALATVAALATAAALSLPHVRRAHVPAVEYEVINTLRSLPPNAVVIASSDELYNGITYRQLLHGDRPDVVFVQWGLMSRPWYRARMAARGVAMPPEGPGRASVRLAADLLARGAPLFVDPSQQLILGRFPATPYGVLLRVVPRGEVPPDVTAVFAQNQRLFATFALPYERPHAGAGWPAEVHRKYAAAWTALARELARRGHADDAAWAAEMARAIGPSPD